MPRTRTALAAAILGISATLAAPATATAAPEATVVPIQVTGATSARFTLVVLGDGYTAAELPKFRTDVAKHLATMWSLEPFKSYRSYFNVYAVEIASPESGVDCDPGLDSPRRDTPLDMGFWGGCDPGSVQRLLTVDDAAAQRYADLVPGTSSRNRQILALGNSSTYGGAGGTYATASGGNALSALISPHELGHSLGGLDDEYDYLARGVPGGPYTGGEPGSVHHTLLTEQQMRDRHAKWWRWLGEPSEAGGTIGRFEGGLYQTTGVWRPSRHSMMKTLGYAFDQVSRERMTQRIAAKVPILAGGTPAGTIGADRVVWVEVLHPVSHPLDVSWRLDGAALPGQARALDLRALHPKPGRHTLTATVTDPTDFVRDPAVRASAALTVTRTWTVDTAITTPATTAPAFTGTTPTDRPVAATDVVYVETGQPTKSIPAIRWTLDGREVPGPRNDFDLKTHALSPGGHTLSATVQGETRTWTVDAQGPATTAALSQPLLTTSNGEYVFNAPFTMKLAAADDRTGPLAPEFRLDGDGWHQYYGWPTDPAAPYLFSARGTEIDGLAYGNLGPDGLTVSPFSTRKPGYGRHTVEYRAADTAGNVGVTGTFTATLIPPPPACTGTITGRHTGPLTITGVTCLRDATVTGPVTVAPGATLVADHSSITGSVTGAVQLLNSRVVGAARLGDVTAVGSTIIGRTTLSGPAIFAGNTVVGALDCAVRPDDLKAPNKITGPVTGSC